MLWEIKRTVSMRWVFLAPITYARIDGYENIHNVAQNFAYLNLWLYVSELSVHRQEKHKHTK